MDPLRIRHRLPAAPHASAAATPARCSSPNVDPARLGYGRARVLFTRHTKLTKEQIESLIARAGVLQVASRRADVRPARSALYGHLRLRLACVRGSIEPVVRQLFTLTADLVVFR